ncbi:hypothetical protein LWF01_11900 [Saxibacter everestensis]|uniref:Tetratricopeptide repeat protein n=1 Tax=Saxibacter everestensis TaxID=2909229 RepID=A0ABY8QPJ0_9MICO|nr:hypothetical protein LWF01_11900 [Brevibacteriaceae bacterium ZFBP1038]
MTQQRSLRRRLLIWSTPVGLVLALVAMKLLLVPMLGSLAVAAYQDGDYERSAKLSNALTVVNVIEPYKAHFNLGDAFGATGQHDAARTEFEKALHHASGEAECMVRANLALTIEAQGDAADAQGDAGRAASDQAKVLYREALTVIEKAPEGCFAGDGEGSGAAQSMRRSESRLEQKAGGKDSDQDSSSADDAQASDSQADQSQQEKLEQRNQESAEERRQRGDSKRGADSPEQESAERPW